MRASTFIRWQKILPHHWVCKFAGLMAFCRIPWLKHYLITDFIQRYQVNLKEAIRENPKDYQHFNDFFTRQLKAEARPLAPDPAFIIPCDGLLSQRGAIHNQTLIQAKNHRYTLDKLLASPEWAPRFEGGQFATFYLSPKDYHRVHMPLAGRLVQMTYVPGTLYSVNLTTAEHIPELFANNERVVVFFEGEQGPWAMVLVGAMIVGSMATPWAGTIAPHQPTLTTWHYLNRPERYIALNKGDEMGLFHLGSTVIVIFNAQMPEMRPELGPSTPVYMGQALT